MNQTKCNEWVARDRKVLAKCQHLSYFPLVVESGSMSRIKDADGNEFIDFLSSASSLNLGSSNPIITNAIEAQMKKCTQYTAAYSYNTPQIEYAERLVSVYPSHDGKRVAAKVVFGNCGSDANDAAIKFARAYTGRSKIIAFINGYHGNTYGSSTLSSCTSRMRDKMGPFLPDIYHFNFARDTAGLCPDPPESELLADMEQAFKTYLPPDEVAAVIIEPIQGDGGMIPASHPFMKKLFALCKQHGILFISEEVQQAFYRTGKFFGIEHYPYGTPDGIILGKSVGAGLTLGAFMARAEIMDSLPAPAHLFTLGGNALSCAAGIAAFDYYQSAEFGRILSENIAHLKEELDALKKKHPDICGPITGKGMSYGINIVKKPLGEPDLDGTFKILYRAYEYGLLLISLAGNVLRIQPPLVISKDDMLEGFKLLERAMADYEAGKIPDDVLSNREGW